METQIDPAPLLVQKNFVSLWFVALSHLQACFCARSVPYSITWLLSTVSIPVSPYFHVDVAELFILCVLCLTNTDLGIAFPLTPFKFAGFYLGM